MILDFFKPKSLDALAVRYGTDKSHKTHNFADFYDRYFSHLRNEPVRLLEIGVGRGASIRMWKKYFPKATLSAIESEPRRKQYWMYGAKIFIGNQEDRKFLSEVMTEIGPVDILIDDGSHRVPDQQVSLGFLFPYVKPGGHYIIEDIHTSFPGHGLDFGLSDDGSNSTYQMLLDFKKTGRMESRYMNADELEYLNAHVKKCETYFHQDPKKHLTSILVKA